MRNKAIQRNLPFVASSDEVVDIEYASEETDHDNIISDHTVKSPHYDALLVDPDEEHSSNFMFDDDHASIAAPNVRSSIPLF